MPRPAIHAHGNTAFALEHLAEEGPTRQDELRKLLSSRLDSKQSFIASGQTLKRLESLGLVAVKVWLTPAGLEELRRMGKLPARAGITEGAAT